MTRSTNANQPGPGGIDVDMSTREPSGWVWWLPGLVVALGAAVATAHGLYEVAVAARVPAGVAWLYPLITDGLALVAYTATARLAGRAVRYAWTVVIVAAGLSGLAQAAYLAGGPAEVAPALRFGVGAWPAIAAAVAAHLLHLLARSGAGSPTAGHSRLQPVQPVQPAGREAVRPAVHSPAEDPDLPPVQPGPYSASIGSQPGQPASPAGLTDPAPDADPGSEAAPIGPPRPPAAARERGQTLAVRHAQRHGVWPTVAELEAVAAVSHGTAAAALRVVRDQPLPLHLVTTDTEHTDDHTPGDQP